MVSVVNEQVLFTHAGAFDDPAGLYRSLGDVQVVEVSEADVPLSDAISSYLFNSQLVTLPDRSMALIAPIEVEETASTAAYLAAAVGDRDHPIDSVHALDLRESMRNGGGPACLRLRVVLTDTELGSMNQQIIVNEERLDELEAWVVRHYREELAVDDLIDPALEAESRSALDELTVILNLGNIYPFQH